MQANKRRTPFEQARLEIKALRWLLRDLREHIEANQTPTGRELVERIDRLLAGKYYRGVVE